MAWVPPAKRRLTESKTLDEHHKNEAVSHRIRGLLNRVSEENIQSLYILMIISNLCRYGCENGLFDQ